MLALLGAFMSRLRPRSFPGFRRCQGASRRLNALGVVLGLLALLAVSGPHRVHHLVEIYAPSDQHSHDSRAQELPDCPVLLLTQYTPIAACCPHPLVAPLLVVERLFLKPLCALSARPQYGFQTRSPPAWLLCDVLSS
jgi:hypothetical protein